MQLLTRHILRTLAAPFGWGVVALTGLLILNQLAALIDAFGGKGLPIGIMAEAIGLAIPAVMTLTLPMAVLTSTLYAYGQLAADLELVAMYASGVSVWRMARPALFAAIGVALVNFLIFDQVVPRSNVRLKTLRQDVAIKTPTVALRPQVLNPLLGSTYLRADRIDPVTGALGGVSVYDLAAYDGARVTLADSGRMASDPNGRDLVFTLYHGEMRDFKSTPPARVEVSRFIATRVVLRDVTSELERRDGLTDRGDREKSGCELLDDISQARLDATDADARRARLTVDDLRRLSGLAPLPLAAVRERPPLAPRCGLYRRFDDWFERAMLGAAAVTAADTPEPPPTMKPADSLPDRLRPKPFPGAPATAAPPATAPPASDSARGAPPVATPPDSAAADSLRLRTLDSLRLGDSTPAALLPPATTPGGMQPPAALPGQGQFLVPPATEPPTGLTTTIMEVNGERYTAARGHRIQRQYLVEYHKKFAIPLASFCFVLGGVALALRFPRGGIGLVIGGSLVIFLAFYILLVLGENLADAGYLAPAVAMHAPLLLFTLIGLGVVALANREMGSARGAGVFDALRGLLRRRRSPS